MGNIFQQFYNIVDLIIVGQTIGKEALAAVGATGSITFLIIGFAQGLTAGLSIITAQRFGAQDFRGVKKSFAVAIIISFTVTAILTVLSLVFLRPLLLLMQTPPDIIQQAQEFICVILGGMFASMAFNLLSNMIRALGDSRTPLFLLIFAVIINDHQCDFGFGVYYQFPHGDRWGWVCDSYRANFRKFDVSHLYQTENPVAASL